MFIKKIISFIDVYVYVLLLLACNALGPREQRYATFELL